MTAAGAARQQGEADVLERLFAPARIAIVGAREGSGEAANLYRALSSGFDGEVVNINPNHDELFGKPCYPNLNAAGGSFDLAIVMVSAQSSDSAVIDAISAEVGLILVYGPSSPSLEAYLKVASTRESRILGPNSLGFLNVGSGVPGLVVHPDNVPMVRRGQVRLFGQSGGLLVAAAEYGRALGLGLDLLVSTGIEADLSAMELAAASLRLPGVAAVGLILEGIKSPELFQELLDTARTASTPLVILKLGRSREGAAHAETHSQALAGRGDVFDDLCRQHGAVTTRTVREFSEALRLIETGARSVGSGVAVVGLSGGLRALVTDLAADHRVPLARFNDSTIEALDHLLGPGAGENPVDLGASMLRDPGTMQAVLRCLERDPSTGVVALVTHLRDSGGSPAYQEFLSQFLAGAETARSRQQAYLVVATTPGGIGGKNWRACLDAGVPVLSDISSLAVVASVLEPVPTSLEDVDDGGTAVGHLLRGASEPVPTSALFAAVAEDGIPCPPSRVANELDEALDAARDIGYPVALKSHRPDLLHKSDAGAVILGISGETEMESSFQTLAARFGGGGFLVQGMVDEGGVELMLGTSQDPQLGRVITVAIGGVDVETYGDAVHARPPVGREHATAMVASLRSQTLLDGTRGRTPVDRDAVAELIVRFSRVSSDLPDDTLSLELNPVIAHGSSFVAVDISLMTRTVALTE